MKRKFIINFVFVAVFVNIFGLLKVNASNASLSINCPAEVTVLQSVTCDVNIDTDANIDTIRFLISAGDFNVNFKESTGFTNSGDSASNVSLHKDNITSGKVGTITVTAPGSISEGEKNISLTKISIINSNDSLISFAPSDVSDSIKVLSNKASNTDLKDITIDGVSIPKFSSSNTEYNVTVYKNKVTIGAVGDDPNTQMIGGLGEKSLVLGDNNIVNIDVTAENGDKKTYKVVINYEIEKNDDNTLKTLELYNNDELIEFVFDPTKTNFNIEVNSDVTSIMIKSTLNDEKAKCVKNYGNRTVKLNYGLNKVEVRVLAENEEVRKYTLNITRSDNRNNVNTLQKLVVNGEEVELSSSVFEYRVDVRYKYTESEIEAIPTSETATVRHDDIVLVDGENTPIILTVTAENGQKQEYKIVINRLSEEASKVVLENIIVKGYDLNFRNDLFDYDLNVKEDDLVLDIEVVPSGDLYYEILGNSNLRDKSTVVIRVTDDDGIKSYTINIHKELDKIMGIPTDIFCYGVLGIGIISLVSSIIYAIRKSKEEYY